MADEQPKADPDVPARGIECPRCGCRHLYVVYTRKRAKRILRVRECRHCRRRITTYEQVCG